MLTIVALILASHAHLQHSADHQIEAIAKIQRLGGFAQYSYVQDANWNAGEKQFPLWLEEMTGQDYLYAIDAFLIASDPDPNAAIEVAATLPGLRLVKLPACTISDDSIKPLANLKRLEWLELFATPATDACMETVSQIRSLKTLDLRGTKVTDDSIDRIVSLPRLKQLNIGNTSISEQGVAKLRAKMPNCVVDTTMQ